MTPTPQGQPSQSQAVTQTPKIAPVQGYAAGIPWEMHLRAYDAYCKRWSPQPALIEGWCRGGFHADELDGLIPGWREELTTIAGLRQQLAAATQEAERLKADLEESEAHNKYTVEESLLAAKTIADMNGEDPTRVFASPRDRIWFIELSRQLAEAREGLNARLKRIDDLENVERAKDAHIDSLRQEAEGAKRERQRAEMAAEHIDAAAKQIVADLRRQLTEAQSQLKESQECAQNVDRKMLHEQADHNKTVDKFLLIQAQLTAAQAREKAALDLLGQACTCADCGDALTEEDVDRVAMEIDWLPDAKRHIRAALAQPTAASDGAKPDVTDTQRLDWLLLGEGRAQAQPEWDGREREWLYRTLDDRAAIDAAMRNPEGKP